jgi:rsbT co-antagonist protein RsbR
MSPTDLAAENEQLRAQVAALKQRLEEQERLFVATLNAIPDAVVISDPEGKLSHVNPIARQILPSDTVGTHQDDWSAVYGLFRTDGVTPFPPEELPLARALRGEAPPETPMIVRNPDRPEGIWVEVKGRAIRKDDGAIAGAIVVFSDLSERKRWERQMEEQLVREQEKNDALARLQSAVTELSTPILEVWDGVLALPVIGVIDGQRSAEMMDKVLPAVEQRQCRFVIIDITGVEVIDSNTADRLVKMVNAVELLGARCILTGVRSGVAQTLVSLGAGLGPVLTLRNLKHGLVECFRAFDRERAAGKPAPPRGAR